MSELRFALDLGSTESSALDLPIEVRRPNLALVARTVASQPVNLEPGIYHVTARLPGGLELSNVVQVAADAVATVQLAPEPGDEPPTGTELSGYLGTTPITPARPRGMVRAGRLQSAGGAVRPELRAFEGNLLGGELTPLPAGEWLESVSLVDGERTTRYAATDDPAIWLGQLQHLAGGRAELAIAWRSGLVLQLRQPGVPSVNVLLPSCHWSGCRVVLARLPSGLCSLDVFLDNPAAELLLRYLERGLLQQAAIATTSPSLQAERLLFEKAQDPIAATVGAYALLRLGELDRLHEWTENLFHWFEWLPDGAAIRGEHLARRGKHDEAAVVFAALASRGLPIFVDGLSYAQDRLRLYVNLPEGRLPAEQRAALQDLLARLQRYAAFVDFRRALVTFPGERPDRPGEE